MLVELDLNFQTVDFMAIEYIYIYMCIYIYVFIYGGVYLTQSHMNTVETIICQ